MMETAQVRARNHRHLRTPLLFDPLTERHLSGQAPPRHRHRARTTSVSRGLRRGNQIYRYDTCNLLTRGILKVEAKAGPLYYRDSQVGGTNPRRIDSLA